MSDLKSKFDDLGYDLLDLDSMTYIRAGIDTGQENHKCRFYCVSCILSCSHGCIQGPGT